MKKSILLSLGTVALFGTTQIAHAQRGPVDRGAVRAGRSENKANGVNSTWGQRAAAGAANGGATGGATGGGNWGGNGQGGGNRNNGSTNGGNDQAAQSALAARTAALRALMSAAGITEVPTQDSVIGFIYKEEAARRPLLAMAQQAVEQINNTASTQAGGFTAVATDPNIPAPDANKAVIDDDPGLLKFQDYLKAVEGDIARYNADLQELDTKIGYSKKPRLEAFLTLIGVLDNATFAFGGPSAVFLPTTQQLTQNGQMNR